MKITEDIKNTIKSRITLNGLLPLLGFPPVRGNKRDYRTRCVLHCGDNKTSFSADLETNRWRCYACNKSGDVIELVKEANRCSYLEAVKWLMDKSGISTTYVTEAEKARWERIDTIRKMLPALQAEHYKWLKDAADMCLLNINLATAYSGDVFDIKELMEMRDDAGQVLRLAEKYYESHRSIRAEKDYARITNALCEVLKKEGKENHAQAAFHQAFVEQIGSGLGSGL